MAASLTVPEVSSSLKPEPIVPRQGVVTLFGFGIHVQVERGHLVLRDGVGPARRAGRFSRVNHGLRRLVVIGSDGMVSLAALRWLHHQKAAFINLERGGKVLTVAGPIGPKDSRLKRAQALAPSNGAAVSIARALLVQKLHAQERIVRQNLNAMAAADNIKSERTLLPTLDRIDALRWAEARAALVYWSAWRNVRVTFPSNALARVPDHWRAFGARRSPLTGSGRLAVNPPNAMLNYLYAILESEARIAAVAVGLDPHLGMLHADTDSRPSLACDLMEAVRTHVDEYVLNCIGRQTLRREWFFEERDGNCRLMAGFAARLAEASAGLASAVAPVAESVAKALARGRDSVPFEATTTPSRRRPDSFLDKPGVNRRLPAMPQVCPRCGRVLRKGLGRCPACAADDLEKMVPEGLKRVRLTENSAEAPTTRTSAQRRNAEAATQWNPESLPVWLTQDFYRTRILVELKKIRTVHVARYLSWSESYAAGVRNGKRMPHPRHWQALAGLAGCSD
jgi:CRISPR-associated endonuclease Cas1